MNIPTLCTTSELVTFRIAVHHLVQLPVQTRAVILTDSPFALQLLQNNDTGFLFARVVADACRLTENFGCTLSLQWIPSHGGIKGNDRADTITAADYHQGDSVFIKHF